MSQVSESPTEKTDRVSTHKLSFDEEAMHLALFWQKINIGTNFICNVNELLLEIKEMMGSILTLLKGGELKLGAPACKTEEEEYIVRILNNVENP